MAKKVKDSSVPQTELELQRLQKLFLEDKTNKQIREQYFMLLRIYARSIALKVIKRKGIFLTPERVDEISTDSTLAVMKQYEKEGWSISVSFAGVLIWKVYEAMYAQANEEMNSSLNLTFSDEKESKEIMDFVGYNSTLPWNTKGKDTYDINENPANSLQKEVNVSFDEIREVIDNAYNMMPYSTYLRFVAWLVLKMRKPKVRNILTLFNSYYLSNREDNLFEFLFLEIHNKIALHI